MNKYKVIGMMSGTSLDGVDIAYCEFEYDGSWKYSILYAETIKYTEVWAIRLAGLINKEEDISITNREYGYFLGTLINDFIGRYKITPEYIASHGHTIYHQPEKGVTLQIGDGEIISKLTGLPVIYDFRSLDVQLGGQGAPLVPIGDKLLFNNYSACLNLGGIANISFDRNGKRMAFDICPVNMVLNHYCKQNGFEFDEDGKLAAKGEVNKSLLEKLNKLDYYYNDPPKSLGREWVEKNIFSIIDQYNVSLSDILRTYTDHIVYQISQALPSDPDGQMLVTGGGAHNKYLMQLFKERLNINISLPEIKLIDFKEALIFGLMGILRIRNEINCLSTVTGAQHDSCSGVITGQTKI